MYFSLLKTRLSEGLVYLMASPGTRFISSRLVKIIKYSVLLMVMIIFVSINLFKEIKDSFPTADITPVQLDLLPLKAQLEIVAKIDILFGMHGAAHAFSIFMPPGGAVVEMFNDNRKTYNWHMNKIATLSGHSYIKWGNTDKGAVDKLRKSITIPGGVSSRLLRMAIDSICSSSKHQP